VLRLVYFKLVWHWIDFIATVSILINIIAKDPLPGIMLLRFLCLVSLQQARAQCGSHFAQQAQARRNLERCGVYLPLLEDCRNSTISRLPRSGLVTPANIPKRATAVCFLQS